MSLRRIDWTQIDTSDVPSGYTIDIGQLETPIDGVYAKNLYLSGTSIIDLISSGKTQNNPNNITGGTFDPSNYQITLHNSTGGTSSLDLSILSNDPNNITGGTFDPSNYQITLYNSTGGTSSLDLSILSTDMTVTGGTYNPNNGIATFTNNSGGTFQVSGFLTGVTDTYITGGTFNNNSLTLGQINGTNVNVSGLSENIIYTTTLSSGLTSNGVGGISSGTTVAQLSGRTFTSLFDDLLFPTINPTLNAPSYSLSTNLSSLLEINSGTTTFSTTITGTFNRGSIVLNGQIQNFRSGAATGYTFSGQNIGTTISQVGSGYTYTITGQTGYMYFNSSVSYSVGPQPYDNKGNPYSTPLSSGTITYPANTLKVEGIYPLYATVYNGSLSAISGFTKLSLISMISPPSTAPSSLTSLGNGIGVNFASELDGGGNGLGYRQTLLVPTGNTKTLHIWLWGGQNWGDEVDNWVLTTPYSYNGINYKKYTYNGSTRGATSSPLLYLTWT